MAQIVPPRTFEVEFSADLWKQIQKQGQFDFNIEGDPARRVAIVLSDYTAEDISGQYDDPNEAALKTGAVKLRFSKKRGA